MDFSRPTNSGTTMCGNTTMSRRGKSGIRRGARRSSGRSDIGELLRGQDGEAHRAPKSYQLCNAPANFPEGATRPFSALHGRAVNAIGPAVEPGSEGGFTGL